MVRFAALAVIVYVLNIAQWDFLSFLGETGEMIKNAGNFFLWKCH